MSEPPPTEQERVEPSEWPCTNYRAPLTCLLAPSTRSARCDHCQAEAANVEAAFRKHALLTDDNLNMLHENAKAYSLAVQALEKVRGGPLSTTLAFLIEQGYLVSADPRAVAVARDRAHDDGLRARVEALAARWERWSYQSGLAPEIAAADLRALLAD